MPAGMYVAEPRAMFRAFIFMRRVLRRVFVAPSLAGALVVACASSSPTPVVVPTASAAPPSQAPVSGTVRAETVAIGPWHLGLPVGVLAIARPDLWKERRFDVGGGHAVAMTLGRRWPAVDDPLRGSHLVFLAPNSPTRTSEEAFAPTVVVALGDAALALFRPSLGPLPEASASFGPTDFTIDKVMREDEERRGLEEAVNHPSLDASQRERVRAELAKRPPWPKILRVESHTSRIATVSVDGRPLGCMLGDVPRDGEDRFYKGLRRLVLTHLLLR